MQNLLQKLGVTPAALLILVIALLVRVPLLGGSFWLDEAAQALESARPLSQQFQIVDDFQPPLIHLIVHFAMYVSSAEGWLRFWASLFPGLITIFYTYLIGKKLFSESVGFVAGLLLATSSFHTFFSQELRPYSLPAMFATLSWWELIREQNKTGKIRWSMFWLWSTLGMYASFLYPFIVFSQAVYIFCWKKEQRVSLVYALVATGVAFLPWVPTFLQQLQAGQVLRSVLPGWEAVVSFSQYKSLPLTFAKFVYGVLEIEVSLFFVVTAGLLSIFGAVVACAHLYQFFRVAREKRSKMLAELLRPLLPVLCWLVLPAVTAWLISFKVPVIQPKRLLFSLPAFYLVIVHLVERAGVEFKKTHSRKMHTLGKWSGVGVLLILFFVNLFAQLQYHTQAKLQREDWRGLYQRITQEYPRGSAITVFAFPAPFASWVWYDDQHYPAVATGIYSTSDPAADLSHLRVVSQYDTVLVFDYLRDITDPEAKVIQEVRKYGYVEAGVVNHQPQLGFIRVFKRQKEILGLKQ